MTTGQIFGAVMGVAFGWQLTAGAVESAEPTPTEKQIIEYMDAGTPTILRLWPEGSERNKSRNGQTENGKLTDKLRVYNTEHPALLVYQPPAGVKRLDSAVIFAPGGGYKYMAMAVPKQLTEWLHHLGMTVAVLKYHTPRHPSDKIHAWPLSDAQRGLRLLRSKAADFGLSPDKIGISGASAGGHLAFNACLNQATPAYEAIDAIDEQSCRPAFGFLFYPAYLGKSKTDIEIHSMFDLSKLDPKKTPPVFMSINGDDRGHVMGNFAAMVTLGDKKVPAEMHIWTRGGHSGAFDKYPLAELARPGARFLVRRGILPEGLLEKSDAWLDVTVDKLRKAPKKFSITPGTVPAGLPDDQLSALDKEVRKVYGKSQPVYRLWPGDGTRSDDPMKPKAESLKARNVPVASDVTSPTMTYFPAANPTGRGVLIFPGGGYGVLAWEHEGLKVAKWLNEQGVHAFLVKYRTPRRKGIEKHVVALQDAHRAIRLVRSQAAAFGVFPDKIGTLGFSAGGHLATLTTTKLEKDSYEAIDDHDKVSPMADFGILIYPAYTTVKPDGNEVDPMLLQKTPAVPTFVATAADDKWTRGQYFLLSSRIQSKTPLAYHVYENGGHGKGINDTPFAFSQWPREAARWLQDLDR